MQMPQLRLIRSTTRFPGVEELVHCPVRSGPTFGTDVTREKLSHGWVSNLVDTALAEGSGQVGLAHQVEIDAAGGAPAFRDGPDDERLSPLQVTGREDPGHARHPVRITPDIAAVRELDSEVGEQPLAPRAQEAHGQENQLRLHRILGARNILEADPAALADHLDPDGVQRGDAPLLAGEVGGIDGILPRAALLVGRGDAEDIRPERPRIAVDVALIRRPGQDLELGDRARLLAMHGAETVRAGIAAPDDDHVLALGGDELGVGYGVSLAATVLEREVIHGEVDAPELAAGDLEVARPLGASSQDDGIEVFAQGGDRDGHPDVGPNPELDPGSFHESQAPRQDALLHLEFGDAVAQEPAHPVRLLEDGDEVAGTIQLLGRGQAGGARANHGDLLPGAHRGRLRRHPALVESVLDDADLDLLDGYGVVVDAEHA